MRLSQKNKKIIGVIAGVTIGVCTIAIANQIWNQKNKKTHSDDSDDESESESEIEWSNIDETKIDDRKKLKIELKKIRGSKSDYISRQDLINLLPQDIDMDNKDNSIIIDVRDEGNDYTGGHIITSHNISEKIFYDKIPDIIKLYNKYSKLIIYDMYGQRRCIKCIEYYDKALNELIANYDAINHKSYYYKYTLKDAGNDGTGSGASARPPEYDSIIDLIHTDNVSSLRVPVDNLNDNIINNLKKQKLFVLKGGYFELINSSLVDVFNTNLINDLDITKYEQLQLAGIYDKTMWYHQNEFFAKAKYLEMKTRHKSSNFKRTSAVHQHRRQ